MSVTVLKGTIVSAPRPGEPDITENGFLVAEDGCIVGVFPELPQQYAAAPVEDFGDALILQSFADLHLHAPQYPMLGTGMDLPLLDWLNIHTFPLEARFADPDYARETYRALAKELISLGTTRVCMFSSLHADATLILMEELEAAGVTGYVGKVTMDRNAAPGVLEETTEESMSETLRWLEGCRKFRYVKPMLTPRFIPSCTDEVMAFLGELVRERGLPVQSHLSENDKEIEWVKELHPDCTRYWEAYAKFGLWTDRTVMAHCIWSDEVERKEMKDTGVTVVHCAGSNANVCSGVAPVRKMLDEGLKVTLGSDIAGGDQLNMFDVIVTTIRTSKFVYMHDNKQTPYLTVPEGWYLATSAGAEFFGEKPGFAPGNPLHCLVLADDTLPPLTADQRFERCIYRRQEDAIRAVWSAGRRVL